MVDGSWALCRGPQRESHPGPCQGATSGTPDLILSRTMHPLIGLLWVPPELSLLALGPFPPTPGPNSFLNYFPLASPNPCHSTIFGMGRGGKKQNGRRSLDSGGVVKKKWGGSTILIGQFCSRTGFKIPLTPPPVAHILVLAYNWLIFLEAGLSRGLVHLKGWERPRGPSFGWSLQRAGAAVPRTISSQDHRLVFSHGLCECGDPAPRSQMA